MIKHCQKIIQLADSSDFGWRVVKEYEKIPIASESDDEKRMYKAEARASRKIKSEKSKRGARGRSRLYWGRRQPEATVTSGQTRVVEKKRPGLCFNCNLPGHWAKDKECPGTKSNNKISINMFVVSGTKSGDRGPISIKNPASIGEKSNSKVVLTSQLSVSKCSEGKTLCMGSENVLKLYDINNAKKCSPVG